jgi:hypothetical protein
MLLTVSLLYLQSPFLLSSILLQRGGRSVILVMRMEKEGWSGVFIVGEERYF